MVGPLPYINNPFIMSPCDGSDGSTVPIDATRTASFRAFMKTGSQADKAYPVIRGLPGNNYGTPFVVGNSGDPVWKLVADSGYTPDSRAAFLGTTGFHAPDHLGDILTGTTDSPFCVQDLAGGFTVFGASATKTGTHEITCSAWAVTYHNTNGLDHANPLSDGPNNTTSRGRLSDAMVIRRDFVDAAISAGTGLGHVLHMFQVLTNSDDGFCHPMTGFEKNRAGWGAEGERIRIKPSIDLTTRGLSPFGLAIARTLQKHGCYIGDNAGNLATLKAQQGSLDGVTYNPWAGLTVNDDALAGITWDDFEVITKGWQAAPVLNTGVSIVQQKNAQADLGTTCTVTLSAPATAGNMLVAIMTNNGNSSNATIPAGFTLLDKDSNTGGCNMTIATKTAAGGEQAITFSCATSPSRMIMTVYEIEGAIALPTFLQQQASLVNSITFGPDTPKGLEIVALSLGTDSTGAVIGDWSGGFDEDCKRVTVAASNNVGQIVGSLKQSDGLVTPTVTWAGTAVNVTGYLLNFSDTVAPVETSAHHALIGGSYVDTNRYMWDGTAWVQLL